MRPVHEGGRLTTEQSQVGFVDEGGALERMVGPFFSQLRGRNPAQLVVDDFEQASLALPVACARADQQRRNVFRWIHGEQRRLSAAISGEF